MKKNILGMAAVLLVLTLAGCPGPSTPSTPATPTLTQTLNAGGNVDLAGASFTENAAINTANITVQNANLGGKTLTVNAAGVTLKNISNANLVIGENVGNGDVTVDGCTFGTITVQGGGANSIHLKTTTVQRVTVEKTSVRVVLEGSTTVQTAEIKGNNAKLEAAENATASVNTLEVAGNTTGVQIQKVNATSLVLKENVKNVTVKDVNVETLEVKENANGTTIQGGSVTTIQIEKEVEKIKIESCTVETAKISEGAGNVELAGGSVENLQVVKTQTTTEVKTIITITQSDTVISNAEIVVSNGAISVEPIRVVVADDIADEELSIPETVSVVTITDVEFDTTLVTDEYKTGTVFDASNAFIIVTFSDGSQSSFAVNPADITVTGFNSSAVTESQSVTLTTSYNGATLTQVLSVAISQMPDYVTQGINLILRGFYDEGVAKFRTFYAENPNSNEAKLYYALAELAAVSTDESVANLLKDYLSIENYPSTMNSLISGDWLTRLPEKKHLTVYEFTENPNGYYVRCNIDESVETYEYRIDYLLDEDNDWISGYTWSWDSQNGATTWTELSITGVAVPSDTGKYMISKYNIINPDLVDDSAADTVSLPAGTKLYTEHRKAEDKFVIGSNSSSYPLVGMSDWFKTTDAYKNTLIKGVENAETASVALGAALLECNRNGLNDLIDDVIAVFDNPKIEAACAAIDSMTDTITLPEIIIDTFNLTEMLGDDDIYFGKNEFNILLSALDIIKGTLQLISSYDLSINLYELLEPFGQDLQEIPDTVMVNLINTKTMAARSDAATRTAAAKASFVNALGTILDSYDAMFGEDSYYPSAVAGMATSYGDAYLPGVVSLKNAIQNGSVFYIPFEGGMPMWTEETVINPATDFGIDMGKLFRPGFLSSIIERNSEGKVDIYTQAEVKMVFDGSTAPSAEFTLEPTEDKTEQEGLSTYYYYRYSYQTVPVLNSAFNTDPVLAEALELFTGSGYETLRVSINSGYVVKTSCINELFKNPLWAPLQDTVLPIGRSPRYSWNVNTSQWDED